MFTDCVARNLQRKLPRKLRIITEVKILSLLINFEDRRSTVQRSNKHKPRILSSQYSVGSKDDSRTTGDLEGRFRSPIEQKYPTLLGDDEKYHNTIRRADNLPGIRTRYLRNVSSEPGWTDTVYENRRIQGLWVVSADTPELDPFGI